MIVGLEETLAQTGGGVSEDWRARGTGGLGSNASISRYNI